VRLRVAVLALAASMLIALGVALRWFMPTPTPVQPDVAQKQPETPVVPAPEPVAGLQDSVVQAGSALTALTARTAEAAVERTWSLVPRVPVPMVEPMAIQSPVEAPGRPFVEAGHTLSTGLEPVTSSARRAVGLFLRDLSPVDLSEKPGL